MCCCLSCREKEEATQWRQCTACKSSFRYDKDVGWTGAGLCPTCELSNGKSAIIFLFWFLGLFFIGVPVLIKISLYLGWAKDASY